MSDFCPYILLYYGDQFMNDAHHNHVIMLVVFLCFEYIQLLHCKKMMLKTGNLILFTSFLFVLYVVSWHCCTQKDNEGINSGSLPCKSIFIPVMWFCLDGMVSYFRYQSYICNINHFTKLQ